MFLILKKNLPLDTIHALFFVLISVIIEVCNTSIVLSHVYNIVISSCSLVRAELPVQRNLNNFLYFPYLYLFTIVSNKKLVIMHPCGNIAMFPSHNAVWIEAIKDGTI